MNHRGRALIRIVTALAVLTALVPAASAGGQLEASKDPETSGPLIQNGDKTCKSRAYKTPEGVKLMSIKACGWWYLFASPAETDATRDYGALWHQVTVTPGKGWCLQQVDALLGSDPSNTQTHSWAPAKGSSTRAVKQKSTLLTVDADSRSVVPGTLSQSFQQMPGRIEVHASEEEGGVAVVWKGDSRAKVALPIGLEISWDAAMGLIQVFQFGDGIRAIVSPCGSAAAGPPMVRTLPL